MRIKRSLPRALLAGGLLLPMVVGVAGTATAAPGKGTGSKNVTVLSDDGKKVTLSGAESGARSAPYKGTGLTSPTVAGAEDASVVIPAGGGSSTESVIVPDKRQQITGTTTFPARATVDITFEKTAGGGTFGCTGFMIGPDTVATAGHCVHNGSSAGFFVRDSFKIYPGRNGATIPYTCPGGVVVGAQRLWTNSTWASGGAETVDYGAIHTTCPIGNTVGWYGYQNTQGVSQTGLAADTRGYPGDKPNGTQWLARDCSASTTTFSQCRIFSTLTNQLFYKNDTFGGQSGSPVYKNLSAGPYAIAIHAYGLHGSVAPHNSNNHGTRIENKVTSFLNFVRNGGLVP